MDNYVANVTQQNQLDSVFVTVVTHLRRVTNIAVTHTSVPYMACSAIQRRSAWYTSHCEI